MSWEQVDAWKEATEAKTLHGRKAKLTGPGWRAFADVVLKEPAFQNTLRFYAHEDDTRVMFKRPCHFRPKAWRAHGVFSRRLPRKPDELTDTHRARRHPLGCGEFAVDL